MTPKEKAQELYHKYFSMIKIESPIDRVSSIPYVKKCALIVVEELLEATKKYDYTLGPKPSYNEYWLKVKYQIEQL